MITALILSEILFYFSVSLAIIIVGTLCVIVAYHLVRIVRELEQITHNLHDVSDDVLERIQTVIEKLSGLPILSFFLNRAGVKKEAARRGRAVKKTE